MTRRPCEPHRAQDVVATYLRSKGIQHIRPNEDASADFWMADGCIIRLSGWPPGVAQGLAMAEPEFTIRGVIEAHEKRHEEKP